MEKSVTTVIAVLTPQILMRLYFFASLTALAIVFQASLAQSQDSKTTFGDPSAEAPIQTRLREVYGKETARVFLLTRNDVLRLGKTHGMELSGAFVDADLARVVAVVGTENGKYSVEYHLHNGKLQFTYETLEYFADRAPRKAWKNFKQIAAWERRTYFGRDAIVYSVSRGEGAPKAGSDSRKLQAQSRRVVALLAKRPQVPQVR